MTSDPRGQGHSGFPLQPLQSLEKFLLLFYNINLHSNHYEPDKPNSSL